MTTLNPWVSPKLVPVMMIVSPGTPQVGFTSIIAKGTEVGAGVLAQPARNRKAIRPIINSFLMVIPPSYLK